VASFGQLGGYSINGHLLRGREGGERGRVRVRGRGCGVRREREGKREGERESVREGVFYQRPLVGGDKVNPPSQKWLDSFSVALELTRGYSEVNMPRIAGLIRM